MNMIKELEALRDEVMAISGIEGKIKARNHIERLIRQEKEKDNFPIPEWLTIKAEDIGADV
jgi:hypothetical protein